MSGTLQVAGLCLVGVTAFAVLSLVVGASASHEPRFHIRPISGDVSAPVVPYRDLETKKMHLFMRYTPKDPVADEIAFYHFISMDYLNWTDNGVVLEADVGYGLEGWSITCNSDGSPVILYTCNGEEEKGACTAVPPGNDLTSDEPLFLNALLRWDEKPVLTHSTLAGQYDPSVFGYPTNFWKNPDSSSEWLVAFVMNISDTKTGVPNAHAVVFATADPTLLSDFYYSHTLWVNTHSTGETMEYFDIFELDEKYYVKFSASSRAFLQDYWVYGEYSHAESDKRVFVEDMERTPTLVDYGTWYASKPYFDPVLKRTILWGWIPEEQDIKAAASAKGWSGVIGMPRNIEYDEVARKLRTYPIPELESLRRNTRRETVLVGANEVEVFNLTAPLHYEITVDFTIPEEFTTKMSEKTDTAPSFGILVRYKNNDVNTRIAVTMPPTANLGKGYTQRERPYKRTVVLSTEECSEGCAADRRCASWKAVDMRKSTGRVNWECVFMSSLDVVSVANASTVTGRVRDPMLVMDCTMSGMTGSPIIWSGRAPLLEAPHVQLRVFVDDTIIEVFKDGGLESLTGRVYVPAEYSGIAFFASNMKAPVTVSVHFSEMDRVYDLNATGNATGNVSVDAAWREVMVQLVLAALLAVCVLHVVLLQPFL
ncbi:beta-fructofuranosidase-like protein [Trypanosoma grayi]|uniref:beta-fructofuranosidase-like protein n=1 Tax=Trypanosoma grayi TaxID=71804 RepID=UPI0004F43EE0|nr:beta-fructofuranosidase-like protein [Trypanosoma grayi]KEG08339.1 beta-fructofuranosidase-like protein [Trypanosoma grayi]